MQRVLVNTGATLDLTFQVDETNTSADGAVTVTITKGDGSAVVTGAATSLVSTGLYRYTLTAAQAAQVDALKLVWSGTWSGVAQSQTSYAEVVGGFLFSLAEGRASDSSLSSSSTYSTALLRDTRSEVEDEAERICGVAFVPRYARYHMWGTGTPELWVPFTKLRAVRSVRVYSDATTYTAFTAGELADLQLTDWGTIVRQTGGVFTQGRNNVVLELEHGYDRPPADVKRAAMLRFRQRLNLSRTGIPDRATSFQSVDGGTYRLDSPSRYRTGFPEVDAAYQRYSMRTPGIA